MPNSFHKIYDFIIASFVPIFAYGCHMATTHISETTVDTAKKFHICSSPVPLAMFMKFPENQTIFSILGINGLIMLIIFNHAQIFWSNIDISCQNL